MYGFMCERETHSGVAFDDGGVDKVEGVHFREGDAEDTEERDEAGIHLVPPSSCLSHGGDKTKILEDFVVEILPSVVHASSVQ